MSEPVPTVNGQTYMSKMQHMVIEKNLEIFFSIPPSYCSLCQFNILQNNMKSITGSTL